MSPSNHSISDTYSYLLEGNVWPCIFIDLSTLLFQEILNSKRLTGMSSLGERYRGKLERLESCKAVDAML